TLDCTMTQRSNPSASFKANSASFGASAAGSGLSGSNGKSRAGPKTWQCALQDRLGSSPFMASDRADDGLRPLRAEGPTQVLRGPRQHPPHVHRYLAEERRSD